MGNFYNPLPPPTANNAGTPPEPHVPIGNQGTSVPPSRAAMFAVTMAVLVASWPADLEPRLTRPNDQQTKIAPLTLTYGQQPPKYSIAARMAQVVSAWPVDLEPRLERPNNVQQKIAPLTLTYGSQPRPQPFLTTVELHKLVASWPADGQLPPRGQQRSWFPTVVEFVPGAPAWKIHPAILQAHQDEAAYDVELVASLVLAPENPDPPPRQFPLSGASIAITLQAWQPDVLTAQGSQKNAAWNVPPIVASFMPSPKLPASIYAAAQVPDALPVQRLRSVVPTFPAVSQPVPQAPLALQTLTAIVSSWAQSWDAQTAPKSAGWNVPPILVSLPYVPPPGLIWASWQPPWIAPPAPVDVAPLALTYGQPPAPQSPLSVAHLLRIAGTWAQTWDAQSAPKSASWNVPPLLTVLPHVLPPSLIWTAWEPPFVAPPRPVAIAPLTLVYGSQPPVQAPLSRASRIVLQSWPPDLEPRLGRPNAERVRITPLTLVYGAPPTPQGPLSSTLLRILTGSWLTDASATRSARTVVAGGSVGSVTVGVIHLTGSNQPSISLTGQGSGAVFDPAVFDPAVFDTGNTIALTGSYQPTIVLTGSVE